MALKTNTELLNLSNNQNWTLKFAHRTSKWFVIDAFNYDNIVKSRIQLTCTLCALVAVSVSISYKESEIYYDAKHYQDNSYPDETVTILRFINLILCFLICKLYSGCFVVKTKKLSIKLLAKTNKVSIFMLSSWQLALLTIELLISVICDPPYFNYKFSGSTPSGKVFYETSTIISTLCFLKVYHFFKLYSCFTIWMNPRSQRLAKNAKIDFTFLFALKADLKLKPLVIIFPTASLAILVTGYAIRNMERGYMANKNNNEFFRYASNGWWNSIITMTTVGYGDVYPMTDSGRVVIFLTAIIGLVLISIYVSSLTSAIELKKQEFHSYLEIKQFREKKQREDNASNLIKYAIFMKRSRDKGKYTEMCVFGMHLKKLAEINIKLANSKQKYLGPTEMLLEIEKNIENSMNDVKKQFLRIDYIGDKLKSLKTEQDLIEQDLDTLINESSQIYSKLHEYNIKL